MDEWELRAVVARWLRIRAEHIEESIGFLDFPKAEQKRILNQLANDADHSWLLVRLFREEEPLPFDKWKKMEGG